MPLWWLPAAVCTRSAVTVRWLLIAVLWVAAGIALRLMGLVVPLKELLPTGDSFAYSFVHCGTHRGKGDACSSDVNIKPKPKAEKKASVLFFTHQPQPLTYSAILRAFGAKPLETERRKQKTAYKRVSFLSSYTGNNQQCCRITVYHTIIEIACDAYWCRGEEWRGEIKNQHDFLFPPIPYNCLGMSRRGIVALVRCTVSMMR